MRYFVKQIGQKDCAFTCLKMMLAIKHKNKDYLYLPEEDCEKSLSFKEVILKAKEEGLILGAYKFGKKEDILKQKNFPILIPLKRDGIEHMVLVRKIKNDKVLFYDPILGVYWIKLNDFISDWEGQFIEVLNLEKTDFKRKKNELISKKYQAFTTIFQILSFILLFAALFFIEKETPFIVTLFLFLGSFLFQFLYQHFLLRQMKNFDVEMFTRLNFKNGIEIRNHLSEFNSYKVALFSTPVLRVNSIFILLAGITILTLNSYWNLINLALVLILNFVFFLCELLFFIRKSDKVENIEAKIFSFKGKENEFNELLEKLQKRTYNQASFKIARKYVSLFLALVLGLIYAGFSNQVVLNYVIFHGYIYYQLGETFISLLETYFEGEKIIYWRCLSDYLVSKNQKKEFVDSM